MDTLRKSAPYVAAYWAAIILANLTTAAWGPEWSIYNAALFVGLVLSTRDRLHDLWAGRRVPYMAALIVSGSALAYGAAVLLADPAVPTDVVARIALASCVAFASAELVDALSYHRLRHRAWLERANTSNIFGAVVDSVVFVCIAFGFDFRIIFLQVVAKVAGGYVWALILRSRAERLAA